MISVALRWHELRLVGSLSFGFFRSCWAAAAADGDDACWVADDDEDGTAAVDLDPRYSTGSAFKTCSPFRR